MARRSRVPGRRRRTSGPEGNLQGRAVEGYGQSLRRPHCVSPDGTFALTLGEGFEYREKAQDLTSDLGKIVRLNEDGSVPPDNPFIGQASVRPEIYSWGIAIRRLGL